VRGRSTGGAAPCHPEAKAAGGGSTKSRDPPTLLPSSRKATVVRENKKSFYKCINNKKRAKENLHPLLDARGNIVNKDEEKAEVLNACCASVFNSQTSYSQGSQHPVLEDREEE